MSGEVTKLKCPDLSLSVIVPAYNEEEGLEATVIGVKQVLSDVTANYEILVIDDKSSDATPQIADHLAAEHPEVRVIHNPENMGLGYNYCKGFAEAQKEHVILVPGDNEFNSNSLRDICLIWHKADMIISYPGNFHIRPWFRKFASRTYTNLINWISGKNIQYYNGTILQKKANLMKVEVTTYGFAYQAEILIQLLQKNLSFCELPFTLNDTRRRSSAFRLKNVATVIKTVLRLILVYKVKNFFPRPPLETSTPSLETLQRNLDSQPGEK